MVLSYSTHLAEHAKDQFLFRVDVYLSVLFPKDAASEKSLLHLVSSSVRVFRLNPSKSAIISLTRRRRSAGAALAPGRLAPGPFGL
jgi:hypothetical protein